MNFTRIGGALAAVALLGCGQAFSDVGGSGAGGASTTATTTTQSSTVSTSSSSPTTGTGGGSAVSVGVGGAAGSGGDASTVSTSTSSAASTSSTGTSSGTLSTTSSSTGGPPPCPIDQPTSGSPCPVDTQVCTYGNACCPVTATCTGNQWVVVTPNCRAPSCPMSPPTNGAACDSCVDGSNCPYDTCSTLDQGTTASCSGDAWQVHHSDSCQGYFACGTKLFCSGTQVCVEDDSHQPPTVSCESDQCAIGQVSCVCDGLLCPAGTTCQTMSGSSREITCD